MELTKEYFDQQLGTLARKEDLEHLRDDFRAVRSDVAEIKETLNNLDRRDREDSDAFAKSIVEHKSRLDTVEDELKNLKLKQA